MRGEGRGEGKRGEGRRVEARRGEGRRGNRERRGDERKLRKEGGEEDRDEEKSRKYNL